MNENCLESFELFSTKIFEREFYRRNNFKLWYKKSKSFETQIFSKYKKTDQNLFKNNK